MFVKFCAYQVLSVGCPLFLSSTWSHSISLATPPSPPPPAYLSASALLSLEGLGFRGGLRRGLGEKGLGVGLGKGLIEGLGEVLGDDSGLGIYT